MTSETQIRDSVDHLFRHNAGQMSAVLTRIFGIGKIDLIEDAIQESMIRALNNWSIRGMPDNPGAWLIQVAKNRILDDLRRGGKNVSFSEEERLVDEFADRIGSDQGVLFANELREDQLRMIFACCHPSLTPDSRIALTLRTVSGFGVREIAAAYLSNSEAVAKLLTRAKRRLREEKVTVEIPVPAEIPDRLEAVLKVLYLMFNEGYAATEGSAPVRKDICYEAIRLSRLLTGHPLTSLPKVHALTALFLFQGSRLSARSGEGGRLIVLPDQDRSLWDRNMIAEGLRHFRLSARGDELSDYHLEAEIASHHVLAKDFGSTDWASVLSVYDELLRRRPSPIVALNRIVALAEVDGAGPALEALEGISDEKLEAYHPFHIVHAELLRRTGRTREALEAYEFAAGLVTNEAVGRFVDQKIRSLSGHPKARH